MKNVSTLLAATVIVFSFLAAYKVFSYDYVSPEEKYNQMLAQAQEDEKKNLCKKSIDEYIELLGEKEEYETRRKVIDIYEKGVKNGEYSDREDQIDFLVETIGRYPKEVYPYEKIIEIDFYEQEFSECAEYIKKAKAQGIKSDYIENAYQTVRCLYGVRGGSYDNFAYCREKDNFYCTSTGDGVTSEENSLTRTVMDGSGSAIISGPIIDMSPITGDEYFYQETAEESDNTDLRKIDKSVAEKLIDESNKKSGNTQENSQGKQVVYTSLKNVDGKRQAILSNDLHSVTGMGNGLICCENTKTGKLDYYDNLGEKKLSGYEAAGKFNEGIAYVKKSASDKYYDIIGTDGKSIFTKKVVDVKQNDLKECFRTGRIFVKFEGDSSYSMVARVEKDKKISYVIVENFKCDDADLFVDGYAAFEQNGKWGFVDQSGKVVINPEYEQAKSFSNGMAAVKKGGKWGFINTNNEMIIEPDFKDAGYFSTKGLCFVILDDESEETENADNTDNMDNTEENSDTKESWSTISMYYWEDTQQKEGE